MKIISLSSNIAGPACGIASSIKRYFYNGSKQTDMFDYLELSLLSIIQVLLLDNIDLISYNNSFLPNINDCHSVTFNNYDRMISHHDLKIDYNEVDYINFIEKYKRRYFRLIESIKTEDIIFFIRYGEEDTAQLMEFTSIIKKLNPSCDFYIINIIYNDSNNNLKNNTLNPIISNVHVINFYDYLDKDIIYNSDLYYRMMQFNWRVVYDFINEHLPEKYRGEISFEQK